MAYHLSQVHRDKSDYDYYRDKGYGYTPSREKVEYDKNVDYAAEIANAQKRGASQAEINKLLDQRRSKLQDMGGFTLNPTDDELRELATSVGYDPNTPRGYGGDNYYTTRGHQFYFTNPDGTKSDFGSNATRWEQAYEDGVKAGLIQKGATLDFANPFVTGSLTGDRYNYGSISTGMGGNSGFGLGSEGGRWVGNSANLDRKEDMTNRHLEFLSGRDGRDYRNPYEKDSGYAYEHGKEFEGLGPIMGAYGPEGPSDESIKNQAHGLLPDGSGPLPGYGGGSGGNFPGGGYDGDGGSYGNSGRPEYESKYEDTIDALLDKILNYGDFDYKLEDDPLFQQVKSGLLREGDRAMQDALGEAASGAGGMNSFAIAAAQQAQNYFDSQVGDIAPEFRDRAYQEFMGGFDRLMKELGVYDDAERLHYGQFRDDMRDWEDDRNFGYGQYRDQVADQQYKDRFEYEKYRDQIADQHYKDEFEYNKTQNSMNVAWDKAMQYFKAGVMPPSGLLAQAGISNAEAQGFLNSTSSKGRRSSGGGSGNGSGDGSNGKSGGKEYDDISLEIDRVIDERTKGLTADGKTTSSSRGYLAVGGEPAPITANQLRQGLMAGDYVADVDKNGNVTFGTPEFISMWQKQKDKTAEAKKNGTTSLYSKRQL